ncbi:MAG TPA: energy-coupling factor ABC transporter substrate-binding protein [Candidatus Sulfotelmatobacter sp.]|jgi:cobalt/nickel transport protein|nr:energy-coupling factor ABC transporter substrate-binding protein [Candidatus Sulfotelmatobacter sp.]
MIAAGNKNGLMLAAAAVIIAAPLFLVHGAFEGSDDQGTTAIEQTGYKPWFQPIWTPPSPEIESLLFALQAAFGAGILGYVIGRRHESGRKDKTKTDHHVTR